jgi:hypothetical protein
MAALLIATVAASAGYSQATYNNQGYVLYGVGGIPSGGTVLQIGGGGDGFVYKGLAAGGELGYVYLPEGIAYGVGVLSLNGSYYLSRRTSARFSPFVSGGYSLAFRTGHENLYNFGGGVTWWAARHFGIRLEFRDYVWPGSEHSPQFRVGVSFR